MHVERGDIVILLETDQDKLEPYIGTKWIVRAVFTHTIPNSAVISQGDLQATAYIKNLEVIPPPGSTFEHQELVKILRGYPKTNYRTFDKNLLGKIGKVRGYDSRYSFYLVRCESGEFGWFPQTSLCPVSFKGEHFFYPLQQVKYAGNTVTVSQIRRTKFNYGQLLEIDGQWVPSTEAVPLPYDY